MKNSLIIFIFSTITFFSCKQTIDCDLVITNANILNVETGNILKNRSIVINKGKIENILQNPAQAQLKESDEPNKNKVHY